MKNNEPTKLMMHIYAVRSFVFYAGYILSAVIYAPLVLILGLFLPFTARAWIINRWSWFVLCWLRIICGISVHIEYRSNLLDRQPCIVMSNHQSSWEALFLQLLFLPSTTVLKKELLKIPFFGWGLKMLEPIVIDRSKLRIAGKHFLDQGVIALNKKRWVLLFPEGTRVETGKKVSLNLGGFKLAEKTHSDIIPVYHNAGQYWPARRFIKFPGQIYCVIGTPIHSKGLNPQELLERYETEMNSMENRVKQLRLQGVLH